MIEIYTDGAASGNGTKDCIGGFAVIVYENGRLIETYSKAETPATNNIMEMKAILYATIKYGKYKPIIYSDSSYAINCFTTWREGWKRRGWRKNDNKEIANLDLIKAYDYLDKIGLAATLLKVQGHASCEGNNLADKLAVEAVAKLKNELAAPKN